MPNDRSSSTVTEQEGTTSPAEVREAQAVGTVAVASGRPSKAHQAIHCTLVHNEFIESGHLNLPLTLGRFYLLYYTK